MPTQRVIEPELLDHASDELARANLKDLRFLNRWLGGHSTLRHAMRGLEHSTILDVGAASGEVKRVLPEAAVVSLDLAFRNLEAASRPAVAADAFRLPFADGAFDVVACSLFLHHFHESEIRKLFSEFKRVARHRIVVLDLERHWLAEHFLPATRQLFRWSPLTLSDGPASVRAGFRADELARLAAEAGLADVRVKRHIPWFRLSLVATLAQGV